MGLKEGDVDWDDDSSIGDGQTIAEALRHSWGVLLTLIKLNL
jgi:hypothetical protein